MKPAAVDYVRADSVAEVTAILAECGDDARVLAGGQSLMPMLNMRLAAPRVLVDISRVAELARIRSGVADHASDGGAPQRAVPSPSARR